MIHGIIASAVTGAAPPGVMPTIVGSNGLHHLTSISLAMPAHVADDILLVAYVTENYGGTVPSGWNMLYNSSSGVPVSGFWASHTVFWRRATAPGTGNIVLTSGNNNVAVVAVIRGCRTTGDPFDASALDPMTAANTALLTLPDVTTTAANTLVVFCAGTGLENGSSGAITPVAVVGGNTTSKAGVTAYRTSQNHGGRVQISTGEMLTAGATSTATVNNGGSDKVCGVTLSFPPA
jgi:hypothetical protein